MIGRLIFLIFFAAATVVGVSIYLQTDDLNICNDKPGLASECQTAGAIVAISGGDTAARTAEAIRLYKAGWSDVLIFSGAALDKTGPSNAYEMQQLAISAGVPIESIYIDEYADSTRENAENTQLIFEKLKINKIILVTSGYHQRRAALEFKEYTKDISIINHPVSSDKDWSMMWWTTTRGWWLAGSEIAKILVFKVVGA